MVKQFTCNSNFTIFDTSLLIVFKPLSSNGGGTQPGSLLASDMWQIHFIKRCRWQMRPSNWEWAHIPGLAGRVSLGMPICSICVLSLIREQGWYQPRPGTFCNVLSMCTAIRQKRANDQKSKLKEWGSALIWEWVAMSLRYVQQIVPLYLQGQACVFFHLLPISHKNPNLSNNMAQLWAADVLAIPQWHVRRN